MPHRETIEGLIAEWDTISVASKRVTLASLIRRIELHPNRVVSVVPTWAPPDPPFKYFKTSARPAKPKAEIAAT